MKLIHAAKLLLGLLLCAPVPVAWAQSGATFQNCQPGDLLKVQCDQPLVVLGKATLLEIGSNTVTVCTASERFTLAKSAVTLVPLGSHSVSVASLPAEKSSVAAAAPGADTLQTFANSQTPTNVMSSMANVQEMMLGKYKNDPGSAKANDYYNRTTAGVMNGNVSQESLVQQAKKVLADCDKYAEERKKDPQYEQQIAALRDFVRRSEAGEKFDFQPVKP